MGYFKNNKEVNFKILREANIYSEVLLTELQSGNYYKLPELVDEEDLKNRDYMEPLLYAVKKEHDTYEVYTHYADNLKENIDLARDIIVEEPELIKDSPVSNIESFILEAAEINPKVILYMSEDLKEDSEFVEELCELNNKEVIMYVAKECEMPDTIIDNPNLANNEAFMKEAIKNDANLLEYTPENLKNDYEFIKNACEYNKDAITYVSEHTEDFEKEAITAAKEVLAEDTTSKAINEFQEELEKVQEKLKEYQKEDIGIQEENEEFKKLTIRERQLKNNIRFIERIKNGEVKPERAIRLINSICKNLGEDYKKDLMKYIKMDDAVLDKQKEEQEKESKTDNKEITIGQVENATEEAKLEKVKEETKVIREEIVKEKGSKEKIGENIDDKSNDERS